VAVGNEISCVQGDFGAWHSWNYFDAWGSDVSAFHWRHHGAWKLLSQKLLWRKLFNGNLILWAAAVPSVFFFFGAVGRRLSQGENLAEGTHWPLQRGATSQHLEKNLENSLLIRIWMAILKPQITWKYCIPKNAKKHNLLKTKRNIK